MALFGKKKPEPEETDDSAVTPQPAKARKWFDHARAMADSFNFETAILYYAQGIRFDPGSLSAHEAILDAAVKHHSKGGKPASSKEMRIIEGNDPASKLAQAEFAWAREIDNPALAVKVLDAAIKADQREFGNMIAARVLAIMGRSKKVSRNAMVQLKDLFSQVGAWNEAIAAGEMALQQNPTDKDLANELKDLAAQRAMDQGGYEAAAGKEGGFREFVKDMDKQQQLVEDEALVGTSGSADRVVSRAKAAWEASPESPDALNKYGQLLRKKATEESLEEAKALYLHGFETIGEYRFKMLAGDISISQLTARIQAKVEAGDEASAQRLRTELLALEVAEYQERAQRYPTDRAIKFRLGELAFSQGDIGLAMECFQKSKDEPKYRIRAGHMLGKSFAAEGWHSDAVAEYSETLAALDSTEAGHELEIRYDLMCSILIQAADEKSVDLAREAMEICSVIARKDITYKDIRQRRREVDALIKELS